MHQSIKSSFIAWKSFLTQTYYNLLFLVSWACARIGVHRHSLCLQYLMFSIHSFCHRISAIGIIISLCVKRQSTGQQPRQPNARSAARQEIEFLCSYRLYGTSCEFSAAAMWVRGLLPPNHVGGETAMSSSKTVYQRPFPPRQLVARRPDRQATRESFTTSVADHSAIQAARAVMSSAGWLHHVGRLEDLDVNLGFVCVGFRLPTETMNF